MRTIDLRTIFMLFILVAALPVHAQLEKQMNSIFSAYRGSGIPGFGIAVVKGTQVIYQAGYGAANLDHHLPITDSSAFDIASVSKQFTGACIALLIMDGKLNLETPASRYIPELAKYKDTIRISHLSIIPAVSRTISSCRVKAVDRG